jgi:hypothetical protein
MQQEDDLESAVDWVPEDDWVHRGYFQIWALETLVVANLQWVARRCGFILGTGLARILFPKLRDSVHSPGPESPDPVRQVRFLVREFRVGLDRGLGGRLKAGSDEDSDSHDLDEELRDRRLAAAATAAAAAATTTAQGGTAEPEVSQPLPTAFSGDL